MTAFTGDAGRPFTVLHVSQPTDYGVANVVAQLAADQMRRGWSVAVACPPEGDLPSRVTTAGATHVQWDATRSPLRGVATEVRALRAIVASVSPDVVHLHSSKAGLVGRLALRGRAPTLFHTHAWSFLALPRPARWLAAGWERCASRWTTTCICCSDGEATTGAAAGIRGRVEIVPNGVVVPPRPGDDQRPAARAALGLAADVPLVVCVGRLCRQKGQDNLLRAWPAVRAAVPGAQLALVGDGPDRQELEALADPSVTFCGFRDDVETWTLAADVVAVPSRYEGLPLALLEAMALGRPVVASDAPGLTEVMAGNPPPGAVTPIGDAGALARALTSRLVNRALADAEGAAARRRVELRYDARRTCDAIAALTLQAAGREWVDHPS